MKDFAFQSLQKSYRLQNSFFVSKSIYNNIRLGNRNIATAKITSMNRTKTEHIAIKIKTNKIKVQIFDEKSIQILWHPI